MRQWITAKVRKWSSGGAARLLVCAIVALPSLSAHAFDLTGTWTTDELNCGKVFVKKNNKISMTRNADVFGGGFIVEGNQIRGQAKTCKITSRKEENGVLHLIASCSTDIAVLGAQELSAKIDNDNRITRIFPSFPEMGITYFRCAL
jgi:hypothetical protein